MDVYFHNLIKKEYEKRQKQAYERLNERQQELYKKIDELESIDRKINMLGVKYSKLVLLHGNEKKDELLKIQDEIESYKKKKEELMASRGFSPDYLKPAFKCSMCRDTGYVENGNVTERCSCYSKMFMNMLYSASNLASLKNNNFSFFNEKYFSDVADTTRNKLGISPRENILRIKERCLEFINNFENPDERNLFFSGSTGVGKTFMASCIGHEILKKGRTVLYYSAPQMFDIIYRYKLNIARDIDYEDRDYDYIYSCELLIIDDLGTEPPSSAKFTDLLNILNVRGEAKGGKLYKTIISANMGVKELYEYYDERIASRIIGSFDVLKFIGEDIRRIKLMN